MKTVAMVLLVVLMIGRSALCQRDSVANENQINLNVNVMHLGLSHERFNSMTDLDRMRWVQNRIRYFKESGIEEKPAGKVDWQDADKKYKAFISKYADDPATNVFRGYYAQILLVRYGVLESGNSDAITYYVDALLASESNSLLVLVAALKKLAGKIPASELKDRAAKGRIMASRVVKESEERKAAAAKRAAGKNDGGFGRWLELFEINSDKLTLAQAELERLSN